MKGGGDVMPGWSFTLCVVRPSYRSEESQGTDFSHFALMSLNSLHCPEFNSSPVPPVPKSIGRFLFHFWSNHNSSIAAPAVKGWYPFQSTASLLSARQSTERGAPHSEQFGVPDAQY